MKNRYEIRGDVTAIMLHSQKHGNKEVLIDTSMLEKAKEFPNTWYPMIDNKSDNFYVYGDIMRDRKRTKYILHRFVMDAPDELLVDHINHNTLDNRLSNLRIVTTAQNQQNRKGATKHSQSKVRGVFKCQSHEKWYVTIRINGRNKYYGIFNSLAEAEKTAIEARKNSMSHSLEAGA